MGWISSTSTCTCISPKCRARESLWCAKNCRSSSSCMCMCGHFPSSGRLPLPERCQLRKGPHQSFMHSFQLGMFYDSMTALSAFIVVCQAENCYHTHLSNAQVTLLPCVSQEKKNKYNLKLSSRTKNIWYSVPLLPKGMWRLKKGICFHKNIGHLCLLQKTVGFNFSFNSFDKYNCNKTPIAGLWARI